MVGLTLAAIAFIAYLVLSQPAVIPHTEPGAACGVPLGQSCP